jgi:riboflavin kinase/FMN adenylyltransferase
MEAGIVGPDPKACASDTGRATHLLSRDFAIGVLLSKRQRGRGLDYPTANLTGGLSASQSHGIYAVRCTRGPERASGVASLGIRPTFDPPQELLEAHLLDFDVDLYGQKIEVALHAYIREEKKFDGIEALIAHMREDEAKARHLLAID